ncbi:MAG: Ni/Fe-hydrogenase, b-type cytochrome subunit [Woeseiaceae bacterium]
MQGSAASSVVRPEDRQAVYVFEAPVRIWHWLHALSIVVLAVTGYLIANPLPSIGGEASEHFMMGNLRMIHFIAGYVFGIGFAVRIYWAIVGNSHSRELFYLPLWRGEWWRNFWEELKFYLFRRDDAPPITGHNPIAQTAYWIFNVLLTLFMIVTGFALYGEGLGLGSWADTWFGWVFLWLGDAQNVRMWHLLGMWLFIVFSILHIYMAFRADVMTRQSSVSSIISGWRTYRKVK